MALLKFRKVILLVHILTLVFKTFAVLLDLHEVPQKNVKGDGIVLQLIKYIGIVLCSKKCAYLSACVGVNFYKPDLKCELLADSVTSTRPAKNWWHIDNMDWLQHKKLLLQSQTQCDSREKNVILSSGIPHCVLAIPKNCQDPLISQNGLHDGRFTISPQGHRYFRIYCDFDTIQEPWAVIQRRIDNTVDFNRLWVDYKTGFGSLTGNFWLGNDNIHSLLSAGDYTLRIDMEDFNGRKFYAEYSTFYVAGEDEKYKLTVANYSGTTGDSFGRYHNGMMFSTKDSNNDEGTTLNCAKIHNGGWWFKGCFICFLNGVHSSDRTINGMQWYIADKQRLPCLMKYSSMKIR